MKITAFFILTVMLRGCVIAPDTVCATETSYFKNGRLIIALKEGTEDNDSAWGLFNCKKSFSTVTFQADVDNLVPNGAGHMHLWRAAREGKMNAECRMQNAEGRIENIKRRVRHL